MIWFTLDICIMVLWSCHFRASPWKLFAVQWRALSGNWSIEEPVYIPGCLCVGVSYSRVSSWHQSGQCSDGGLEGRGCEGYKDWCRRSRWSLRQGNYLETSFSRFCLILSVQSQKYVFLFCLLKKFFCHLISYLSSCSNLIVNICNT